MLIADGDGAVLRDVDVSIPDGATVTWSIYRPVGTRETGAWEGLYNPSSELDVMPAELQVLPRPIEPFSEVEISRDREHPTWLIATIHSETPGAFALNVSVKYTSGWRPRTTWAGLGCVLVTPIGASRDDLEARHDDLSFEFDVCLSGTLLPI